MMPGPYPERPPGPDCPRPENGKNELLVRSCATGPGSLLPTTCKTLFIAMPSRFRLSFQECKGFMVNSIHPSPVTQRRRPCRRQDFVRVGVQVRKEDAALVRDIATTPVDPGRETEKYVILREKIAAPRSGGLDAPLAPCRSRGLISNVRAISAVMTPCVFPDRHGHPL